MRLLYKIFDPSPVKAGFAVSVIISIFAIYLFSQNRCVLLPTDALECRSNFAWLLDSPLNEIGDTLAGFAGTLAFIWIVTTVSIQSKELSEQREQLRQQTDEFRETNKALAAQRFDQAFFGLLSTYGQIISDLDLTRGTKQTKGRDCFVTFSARLASFCRSQNGHIKSISLDEIKKSYDEFWNENQANLGHYFRFLYNTFRFISENEEYARPHHYRLLRSQLSDQELQLLFYNCLSRQGNRFQKYAVQFSLFDNLPRNLLFHPAHASLMPVAAWGGNSSEVKSP